MDVPKLPQIHHPPPPPPLDQASIARSRNAANGDDTSTALSPPPLPGTALSPVPPLAGLRSTRGKLALNIVESNAAGVRAIEGPGRQEPLGSRRNDSRVQSSIKSVAVSLGVHVAVLIILALVFYRIEDTRGVPILLAKDVDWIDDIAAPIPMEFEVLSVDALHGEAKFDAIDELVDAVVEPDHAAAVPELSDSFAEIGDSMGELSAMLDHAGEILTVDGFGAASGGTLQSRRGETNFAGTFGGEVGQRLARAGAKSGDIQVSLAWSNLNDIDLHVIGPAGERIYFGHRQSRCGGCLDVDMNAGGLQSIEPVENVYWPRNHAPAGKYRVFVHHFANRGGRDPTPFEVYVLANGRKSLFRGVAVPETVPLLVAEFDHLAGGLQAEFPE